VSLVLYEPADRKQCIGRYRLVAANRTPANSKVSTDAVLRIMPALNVDHPAVLALRKDLPALTVTPRPSMETLLQYDRYIVATALVLVTFMAWAYTLAGVGMPDLGGMALDQPSFLDAAMRHKPWSATHAAIMFAMWSTMMIAMMTPSAAPMVLLFTAINRKRRPLSRLPSWTFIGGYFGMWAAFSLAATLAQWGLDAGGLLTPLMASTNPALGGAILVAAGLYQFSALKAVCLTRCQHPVRFLTRHWRPGADGAFVMGITHGAYCLGCCWFLMALLFVGGVMNIYWIGGISIYVALEKFVPHGLWLGRAAGITLVTGGLSVFLHMF